MSARTSAPTRLALCPTVTMACSRGFEFQCDAIDAIAQMSRRRSVVEDMAEIAPAAAAVHLVAHHAVAVVRLAFDRARQRIVEARPAGPALEFHLGYEQGLVAGGTAKGAGALLAQQCAAPRHLGAVLAHDRV